MYRRRSSVDESARAKSPVEVRLNKEIKMLKTQNEKYKQVNKEITAKFQESVIRLNEAKELSALCHNIMVNTNLMLRETRKAIFMKITAFRNEVDGKLSNFIRKFHSDFEEMKPRMFRADRPSQAIDRNEMLEIIDEEDEVVAVTEEPTNLVPPSITTTMITPIDSPIQLYDDNDECSEDTPVEREEPSTSGTSRSTARESVPSVANLNKTMSFCESENGFYSCESNDDDIDIHSSLVSADDIEPPSKKMRDCVVKLKKFSPTRSMIAEYMRTFNQ